MQKHNKYTPILILLLVLVTCSQSPDLPVIAVIDDHPIYIDELELLGRLAASKAGLKFDSEEGQDHYHKIAPNLYNTLIDIYVMQHAAEKEGFTPSDEEVEAAFSQFKESLQKEGGYDRLTKSLGVTEERLKETIRDKLAMEAFQNVKMQEGKREPSEKEIEDYYYSHHAGFRHPARIRASHIFIGPDSEGDQAKEKARQRAEQLRKMIGDSPEKTFVNLARQYSEEPGTAPRGGDLGFVDRNHPTINKQFRKAAFALEEGEVSDVVETEDGFHIIWCTDHEQSLEEARKEIRSILIKKSMTEHFAEWLRQAKKEMDIEKKFDPETFTVLEDETE